MPSKCCKKCLITKQYEHFHKDKYAKFGYSNTCKECKAQYRLNNKDKIKAYHAQNYINNKEEILQRNNEWLLKNPTWKAPRKTGCWKKRNPDKVKKNKRDFYSKKKNDPIYALSIRVRNRTRKIFSRKGIRKDYTFPEYIGCSKQEFKDYIESKFTDDMNWDALIKGDIHIDHIIPLCMAKTPEDILNLCHYTNLQPLWAIDNLRKGAKHAEQSST